MQAALFCQARLSSSTHIQVIFFFFWTTLAGRASSSYQSELLEQCSIQARLLLPCNGFGGVLRLTPFKIP